MIKVWPSPIQNIKHVGNSSSGLGLSVYMHNLSVLKNSLIWSPHQEDFLGCQVTFNAYLPRVQVSHPLTKSLTKMSKKWPWVSKIYEQLAKRTSLDSSFSQALFIILVYMCMLQVKITFR